MTEVAPNQRANIHFFCSKGNENHELCIGPPPPSPIRNRIMPTVKRVVFMLSY
jgi:hypothetical protein